MMLHSKPLNFTVALWTSALLLFCLSSPAHAQDGSFTELGIYAWGAGIDGDAQFGNVETDIDVSFSDILENLDIALMGYAEHRCNRWSFIIDGTYAEISGDGSASNNVLTVSLDADIKQAMVEGFIGYRIFQGKDDYNTGFGIDILGGARYNHLDIEIGLEASALGLTRSAERSRDEDWIDGVAALRAQYAFGGNWGLTGWADAGTGDDSSSYQLLGMANYTFSNGFKLFGGYRYYNYEFEDGAGSTRFEIDAANSGPLLGASYRF